MWSAEFAVQDKSLLENITKECKELEKLTTYTFVYIMSDHATSIIALVAGSVYQQGIKVKR